MRAQLDTLAYAHTSFFTTQVAEELADDLVAHAPAGIGHVFFVSGGSEAVEAALKLARQYFVERGEPQRRYVIARRQSYHGITLGALAVGGREWQRQQFAPLLIETHHVSPVYEYRDRRADETPQAYGERLAEELEAKIEELGGDNVIAFVADGGRRHLGRGPGGAGYFKRVREICDRHGVLLILDEVMRHGPHRHLRAQQDGISPDLMAIAKGLGGGYAPIGALLMAGVFETIADRARSSTATPSGHPSACAAALAVQRVMRRDDLLANVGRRARIWRAGSRSGSATIPSSATRGRGLFQASSWSPTAAPRSRSIRSSSSRAPQARSDGARPDGLSDGRHRRWRARRSCCWRRPSSWTPPWWTPSSNGSVRRSMPTARPS